jgi:hypothetical protein
MATQGVLFQNLQIIQLGIFMRRLHILIQLFSSILAAALISACGGADAIDTATPPIISSTSGSVASMDSLSGTETYSLVYAATQIGIDQRPVTATFSTDNSMNAYYAATNEALTLGTMSNFNTSGSNLVQIGRWAGGQFGGVYFSLVPASTSFALSADQGWHYAIGKATVNLPCSGTMTYALAQATPPTKQNGTHGSGTLDTLTVTIGFNGSNATSAQTNASISVSGNASVNGASITLAGSSSTSTLGAQRRFNMPMSPVGGGFTGGNAYGLFAGANAQELGVAYILSTGATNQGVTGSARLTRTADTSVVCP